jgi:hypothetical protein
MPCPSHSPWFNLPNDIWWWVQIMELHVSWFSGRTVIGWTWHVNSLACWLRISLSPWNVTARTLSPGLKSLDPPLSRSILSESRDWNTLKAYLLRNLYQRSQEVTAAKLEGYRKFQSPWLVRFPGSPNNVIAIIIIIINSYGLGLVVCSNSELLLKLWIS